MKKGGIFTTLFSLLLFIYGAFLVLSSYVQLPVFFSAITDSAKANFAISDGEKPLLIPGLFLLFESFMILICRRRKPYTLIILFYLFFVYLTLIVFTHLRMGLASPSFIMAKIDASRLPLVGVLIFLEVILALVLMYVTGIMNKRAESRKAVSAPAAEDMELPQTRSEGRYMSRRKMKRIEEKEKRREEKREAKERRKEEKRQKKLDLKAEAEAEKAEKEMKAEAEREEKKQRKKEEKLKRKEERKRKKEGLEPSDDTEQDDEDVFSTDDLNVQMNMPKKAVSLDEPLSFPEFKDIPRLSTIEHSEDLDTVSPDPQVRFKESMGLVEPSFVESRFTPDTMREEDDAEDDFTVPSTPKYDPSQAGSHFKKGGILEATIESMNDYDNKSVKRPTSPILGLDEKSSNAQDFKKSEENFAPSNLSKDHPRYKLFESLRRSPGSQGVNVSHMPSMPFSSPEDKRADSSAVSYDSTFVKEGEQKRKLSERLDEMKRESLSSTNPYSTIIATPTASAIKGSGMQESPIVDRSVKEEVVMPRETEPEKASAASASPMRAEDIESVDQKNKGRYDDGSDYTDPRQENEIYYSVGIGGLQSNDAGMTGIRQRARMHYTPPTADILVDYPAADREIDAFTVARGQQILNTLHEFKVDVSLDNIVKGPTVTMYELKLADGVPVSKVKARYDDLQYALGVRSIRILAPVPGKQAVGVEVPNTKRATIGFKDMLYTFNADKENAKMAVPMILGRTITGEPISINVAKAPHLLIAGSTGSGKSVGINSLIATILYNKSPRDVRLIMVDPKVVELKIYNGIPHLLTPVITDAKKVQKVLAWLTEEMDRRYEMISRFNVRNIEAFNDKLKRDKIAAEKLPYIVLIMDEYADLMSTIGKDIEYYVGRLTAMARAVGIHLVLATQRPSAEVVTGTIKNNIPSRIAFAVASGVNSKIILDEMGAESLLGKGDMLYKTPTSIETLRIQGAFLSDGEVEKIVEQVKQNGEPDYLDDAIFEDHDEKEDDFADEDFAYMDSEEEEYERAKQIVYEKKSASASYLQRRMKIGYNKAARYVERMEEDGIVGPPNGSKPREIIKMV